MLFHKGNALCKLNLYTEAVEAYTEAIKCNPENPENANAYFNMGEALCNHGDYEGAVRACDEVIRINQGHVLDAYNRKGVAFCKLESTIQRQWKPLKGQLNAILSMPMLTSMWEVLIITSSTMRRQQMPLMNFFRRSHPQNPLCVRARHNRHQALCDLVKELEQKIRSNSQIPRNLMLT